MQKCQNAKTQLNMLQCTQREHGILVDAHLTAPLTSKIRLALFVVNSIKLHLIASKVSLQLPDPPHHTTTNQTSK